jgi:hypothetical protein
VSAAEIALVTLVVGGGAALQAVLGFGLGLVAAPILHLIDPELVPGPLLFVMVPLTVLVARRERGSLDLRGIRWALVGRVPGTVAGTVAVASFSERSLGVLLGGVVLLAVVVSVVGWHVQPTSGTLLAAGVASGFMGTATSIGGPPMAMVYQRRSGPELRATLAAYFVVAAGFSLLVLAAAGEFDRDGVSLGLWLLPGVLAGYALSGPLGAVLDKGRTRPAVLAASATSALVLIAQQL